MQSKRADVAAVDKKEYPRLVYLHGAMANHSSVWLVNSGDDDKAICVHADVHSPYVVGKIGKIVERETSDFNGTITLSN